jgi:hypothetical protein
MVKTAGGPVTHGAVLHHRRRRGNAAAERTMNPNAATILSHLQSVAEERARRRADSALADRVVAIKRFQHARFAQTYADALGQPRYAAAARFFLDDLYGPRDFSERDEQFARIVGPLTRLFPAEIVGTVAHLAELHALSEMLDSAMGLAADAPAIDAARYVRAWQAVGQPEQRERQVALMLAIGYAIDRYTRNPILRHSLRLMRGPAHAAGLAALQGFLEKGFDTFRSMRGADPFLQLVAERERELIGMLFTADGAAVAGGSDPVLGKLP